MKECHSAVYSRKLHCSAVAAMIKSGTASWLTKGRGRADWQL